MSLKILLFMLIVTLVSADSKDNKRSNKFDIYIFTQHWPYSTCLDWQNSGKGHSCSKIASPPQWSVHGLWPTRYKEIAPNFCNNSWHYDHSQMTPIMSDLEMFWPDVEIRDVEDSLWQHEWKKHGTCATLPENETNMTSQQDYFRKGCELSAANPLVSWLREQDVTPNNTVHVTTQQVWDAVVAGTGGFRPHIDCVKIDDKAYITEIKVCYDKSFQRVNCDGIVSMSSNYSDRMMGTCLKYDSFIYPASASTQDSDSGSGVVVGVVCAVLGVGGLVLGVGYYFAKKYTRRGRGYESL